MNRHLTPEQVLAYVDGELSKSETRRATEHLHSCWTCLAEMERLKDEITTIFTAQNESFTPALPTPPQPWPGVEAIRTRSLSQQQGSVWARFGVYLGDFFNPVRVLALAVTVTMLMFGAYTMFQTSTVSAKEILRRVQFADAQRSTIRKGQVIRERVHIRKTTRASGDPGLASLDIWKSPTAAYWRVKDGDSAAVDLKTQYQAHGIPVDLPLSAGSTDSWAKAAGGNPTVSRQGADVDLTFVGSGNGTSDSVRRVSLLIQPQSWRVKQMTLSFPDISFEITEDEYLVMRTSEVPADVLAYLELPASPPIPVRHVVEPVAGPAARSMQPPALNLDKVELEVFAIVHTLKADLGEPVTITRSSQGIRVGLWQLPADRQAELHAALSSKPGVQLELADPRVSSKDGAVAEAMTLTVAESNAPLRIEMVSGEDDRELLKYFVRLDREQDFTDEALGTSSVILSHLYALRTLRGQFPVASSSSLRSEEQVQLQSLVRDHVTAISANVDALHRQLLPLNANFGVLSCASSLVSAATSWQTESLEALETARAIDHLLRALLTTNQAPAAPNSALPQINQNLCRLQVQLIMVEENIH